MKKNGRFCKKKLYKNLAQVSKDIPLNEITGITIVAGEVRLECPQRTPNGPILQCKIQRFWQ